MKSGYIGKRDNLMIGITCGVGASLTFAMAIMCVIATMVDNAYIKYENLKYIVPWIHFVALFAGGIVAGCIGRKKLVSQGCVVAAVYVICLVLAVVAFDGRFDGVLACISFGTLGSVGAVFVHMRQKTGVKKRFIKRKIC